MMPEFLSQLPSLGVSGLLFVMWWFERQERTRGSNGLRDALQYAGQIADVNRNLLDVIQANTEAVTALREELRSHRSSETEWLSRLTQRLEELACA
jgi:hypothetical protein